MSRGVLPCASLQHFDSFSFKKSHDTAALTSLHDLKMTRYCRRDLLEAFRPSITVRPSPDEVLDT